MRAGCNLATSVKVTRPTSTLFHSRSSTTGSFFILCFARDEVVSCLALVQWASSLKEVYDFLEVALTALKGSLGSA
jgi:hypothetical protein